jgi:hypothetical protein
MTYTFDEALGKIRSGEIVTKPKGSDSFDFLSI